MFLIVPIQIYEIKCPVYPEKKKKFNTKCPNTDQTWQQLTTNGEELGALQM